MRALSLVSRVVLLVVLAATVLSPIAATAAPAGPPRPGWTWPVHPFRIVEPFVAPAHQYGAGHRGIDLEPTSADASVVAPAAGVIAFAGPVAGRGVITVDHGDGYVTTLEPVVPHVTPGTPVVSGERVATLSVGGHTPHGALHFGVRLHGEYINPLVLLGEVPRAVLLPCCDPLASSQRIELRSPVSSMRSTPASARTVFRSPATVTDPTSTSMS